MDVSTRVTNTHQQYGCSNLVIAITTSLTLHGQTRLAESCEKGLNYTVHLLNNENEINECYKLTGHRHSSQARFQLIIKKQYPNFNPNIESSCSSNSATSPCLNVSGHLNDIEISNDIPLLATEIVPINVKDKSNKRKVSGKKKKKIDAAHQYELPQRKLNYPYAK